MDSISEFAMQIQQGDKFLSMDMYKGYRHFRLAPVMRDWFILHYHGRYFQCVALPFGCGRSPLWFTQLVAPFVKELRKKGYRVLPYLDDFLIAPTPLGVVSTRLHCRTATKSVEQLLRRLGLYRYPTKGCWTGSTDIQHLGVRIDSVVMKFFIAPRKIKRVQALARKILREVRFGKRRVKHNSFLRSVCVPLAGHALGQILYALFVLGHVQQQDSRCLGPRGLISSEHPRLTKVERTQCAGAFWTPPCSFITNSCGSYGRTRCRIRRYIKPPGPSLWDRRTVASTRNLELERPGTVHQLSRAEGHSPTAVRILGNRSSQTWETRLAFAHRQPSSRSRGQLLRSRQSSNDARTTKVETHTRPAWFAHKIRIDPVSGQQICERAIATLLPRRLADQEAAKAFRNGWNASPNRRVSIPSSGRASEIRTTPSIRRASIPLGYGTSPSALPASRSDHGNIAEAAGDASSGPSSHTRLATPVLAQHHASDGSPGGTDQRSTPEAMDRIPKNEREVGSFDARNQPRMNSRSSRRLDAR